MARNEWPLIGLSVSYALHHHVDTVIVLDHASTDASIQGLHALKTVWGDRLQIHRLDDDTYLQEAATTLLIAEARNSGHDWVYVFDADEFLLTPSTESLPELLNSIDHETQVLSYSLNNWVAPQNFDDTDVSRYDEIVWRALPDADLSPDPHVYINAIRSGGANFYDYAYPPKVIFRNGATGWLGSGSHSVKYPLGLESRDMRSVEVVAAHLPLLSFRRLANKSAHGASVAAASDSELAGWQNRIVHEFDVAGQLDDYWLAHSIPSDNDPTTSRRLPTLIRDESLSDALGPVIERVAAVLDPALQTDNQGRPEPATTALDWSVVAPLVRDLQTRVDELNAATYNAHVAAQLAKQRVVEAEVVAAGANEELNVVINSNSWRLTAPLRNVRQWWRTRR